MPQRVLIIEDNPANRTVTLRAVSSLGYAALATTGEEQALESLDCEQFAVILMDCEMPGLNGYQCAERIRRIDSRTPIIAMTGDAAGRDPERCRAAGIDDYLAKPVHVASLSHALKLWMGPEVPTGT